MKKLAILIFLISSNAFGIFGLFGYSSYDECMKEEIKDNDGKSNSYIEQYCSNLFYEEPAKKSYGFIDWDWDDWNAKYEWVGTGDTAKLYLGLLNKSNKVISRVKIYSFAKINGKCTHPEGVTPKNAENRMVTINPGAKGRIYVKNGYENNINNCSSYWLQYTK